MEHAESMLATAVDQPQSLHLTAADVEEFRAIMQEESGVALTETEAWNRAIELINLVRMLLGPIPEDPESAGSQIV